MVFEDRMQKTSSRKMWTEEDAIEDRISSRWVWSITVGLKWYQVEAGLCWGFMKSSGTWESNHKPTGTNQTGCSELGEACLSETMDWLTGARDLDMGGGGALKLAG